MKDLQEPNYEVRKTLKGEWYWIYLAANQKEIARSSETYRNRQDCLASLHLIKNSKSDHVFDITRTENQMIQ